MRRKYLFIYNYSLSLSLDKTVSGSNFKSPGVLHDTSFSEVYWWRCIFILLQSSKIYFSHGEHLYFVSMVFLHANVAPKCSLAACSAWPPLCGCCVAGDGIVCCPGSLVWCPSSDNPCPMCRCQQILLPSWAVHMVWAPLGTNIRIVREGDWEMPLQVRL